MSLPTLLSLQELDYVAPKPKVPQLPEPVKWDITVVCTDPAREGEACAWMEALVGRKHKVSAAATTEEAKTELILFVGSYESLSKQNTDGKKILFLWPAEEELRIMHQTEVVHKRVTEVWIYPQAYSSASMIDVLTMSSKIRIVPQIWSANFVRNAMKLAQDDEFSYDAPTRDAENGQDVVILSDLISSSSSILYPVLACELAEVSDSKLIRNVIIMVSASSALPSASLFNNFIVGPKIKYVQCKPADVVPYFMARKQYSVFLYHQMDRTETPDLLWALAYAGFPLLHNLKTGMNVGLRFVDNEIHKVAKFLSASKESYNEDYLKKNREALSIVAPDHPNVFNTLGKIGDEWDVSA